MAKETVDAILKAEKFAFEAEEKAKLDAVKCVDDARNEADKLIAEEVKKATDEAEKILSSAEAEAAEIMNKATDDTRETFKISQNAFSKKEEAVKAVINKLI